MFRHSEGQKASVRIPELQKAQPGSAELILRAEPTVASILKVGVCVCILAS